MRAFVLIVFVSLSCSGGQHTRSDADAAEIEDATGDTATTPDADLESDAESARDTDPDHEVPTIGGGDAPDDIIPRALFEPEVDGELSEWPPLRYRLDTETTALRYGPDQRPPIDDAQLLFDLRWTENALYFAGAMRDDEAFVDSELVWQDDSVELYVDGDNNDEVPSYDENDHQYTVVRDLRLSDRGEAIDPTDQGIRYDVTTDGAHFNVELAVPWSAFGEAAPAVGRILGIDVAFNDDDDGDEEETHLVMWLAHQMTELGSPVQDTSLFHDLELGE